MIEREYCEPRAAACRIDGGKTDDHCLIQGCLDGVAQRVRAASDPTQAANALSACALGNVKNDGGCPGFELCVDPDAGAEAGPPDATVLNAPSQVVALPGDKLGCIDCARTECSSEACLPTSPDGAQLSTRRDDCLNYRACLRACAQGYGMGRHEYAACAATTCDTRFDAGVKQFQSFRSCLVKSCAGCGGG